MRLDPPSPVEADPFLDLEKDLPSSYASPFARLLLTAISAAAAFLPSFLQPNTYEEIVPTPTAWLDGMRGGHAVFKDQDMPGFKEPQPPTWRKDPFSTQFSDWLSATWNWVNAWSPQNYPSIVLFATLVSFARLAPRMRLVGLVGMVVYCYFSFCWEAWLLFAGTSLAQLKMLEESAAPPSPARFGISLPPRRTRSDFFKGALFVAGLHLLSVPDYGHASTAPGYKFILRHLNPSFWHGESWRFPHCLGALLTVYATSSIGTNALRSIFTSRYAVYLGRISYALYLVHCPVVHMLGFWIVPAMWRMTWTRRRPEDMLGKEVGWLLATEIVTAATIWAADLFWRLVDRRIFPSLRRVHGTEGGVTAVGRASSVEERRGQTLF
ncbi:hypothetical protein EJ06DRAFT_525269 [Trichodelitschia bisporula]|uniref:Acyltransferase 3 domain-containing protein n=1 Tax=Trichodelitschia bisporula TaxID=703511 RepID=A0A6G1HHW1_9PEZI|nr:hypothetical protein EJ06DRAFT_525269 [Trichodelitschia bisporula]